MTYFIAILCVFGIAAGQILFKLSANSLSKAGSYLDPQGLGILVAALALYGITTLAWVWVLQKLELGRAYPLMALAFVIVPIASHLLLHEKFTLQYFLGVLLIVAGIIISVKSA